MKLPKKKRNQWWRLRGALGLILIVLVFLLLRSCSSQAPKPSSEPELNLAPAPEPSKAPILPLGRSARLTEPKDLSARVSAHLQKSKPAMEACLETHRDDAQVSYQVIARWNGEGAWAGLSAVPAFTPLLKQCVEKELSGLKLEQDPGMRDREFEFELRIR